METLFQACFFTTFPGGQRYHTRVRTFPDKKSLSDLKDWVVEEQKKLATEHNQPVDQVGILSLNFLKN